MFRGFVATRDSAEDDDRVCTHVNFTYFVAGDLYTPHTRHDEA